MHCTILLFMLSDVIGCCGSMSDSLGRWRLKNIHAVFGLRDVNSKRTSPISLHFANVGLAAKN